jgi:hypothetical protein
MQTPGVSLDRASSRRPDLASRCVRPASRDKAALNGGTSRILRFWGCGKRTSQAGQAYKPREVCAAGVRPRGVAAGRDPIERRE